MKKLVITIIALCMIVSCFSSIDMKCYASAEPTVTDVFSGGFFNGALMSDGSLWMWGEGFYLGPDVPEVSFYVEPYNIMNDVKMVSCGRAHTLVLKNNGDLYTFGLYGGIGLEEIVGENYEIRVPAKIMENVKYIDAGGGDSCAVTNNGDLYVWYSNFVDNATTRPVKVMEDVICAAVGEGCWLAVKSDNTLWSCGSNIFGQLGDGTTEDKAEPVQIMEDVVFVDAEYWGWSYAAAIKKDGSLWTWGLNEHGELGNGGVSNATTYGDKQFEMPILTVPSKIMDDVETIHVGTWDMCAVTKDGKLYSWGNFENSNTPKYIMDDVLNSEISNNNPIVAKKDGSIWVYGGMGDEYVEEYVKVFIDTKSDCVVWLASYITEENLNEIDNVSLGVQRKNENPQKGVVAVAFYDINDKLISVGTAKAQVTNLMVNVDVEIKKAPLNAVKIKTFIWNDMEHMQPLGAVAIDKIN